MRSKVDFKKMDGDDDSSKSLMEKYSVTGFPRLVFTDNSGTAFVNHRGGFGSTEDFLQQIGEFVK